MDNQNIEVECELPELPKPAGYYEYADNTIYAKIDNAYSAEQMQAYARAALKAQPAPTEAQGNRLLELFKHTVGSLALHDQAEAERIGKLYRDAQPSGNTGELVQGEDSARLDAAHTRLLAAVKVYSQGYMQDEAEDEEDCVCGAAQHAEAKEVFAAIAAVERASAPQPQEQS